MSSNKSENALKTKSVKFSSLSTPNSAGSPSPVSSRSFKEKMNKSKFYGKNKGKNVPKQLYTQALSSNIKEILKIKESFSQLSKKKVEEIHKNINNLSKLKSYISMTTKRPSCKQIIISMGNKNITTFMKSFSKHVANINQALKSIKSDNLINFIHLDY